MPQVGQPDTLYVLGFSAGLVGQVHYELRRGSTVIIPRTNVGVTEDPPGSRVYSVTITAPSQPGTYLILWDDNAGTPVAGEEVIYTAEDAELPTVTGAGQGPCQAWTSTAAVAQQCGGTAPPGTTEAIVAASEVLWTLSGRQFGGECLTTVRPHALDCWDALAHWRAHPFDGARRNLVSGVRLPGDPVTDVIAVRVDGVQLAPDDFYLVNRRDLYRVGSAWPRRQNLDLADTEPGTWSVTYRHGNPPPVAGQLAAAALACQLGRAAAGRPCDLPAHVQQVVRQGVTMRKADRALFDENGRTGLPAVDAFLAAYGVKPGGARRRAAILSPDTLHRSPARRST